MVNINLFYAACCDTFKIS